VFQEVSTVVTQLFGICLISSTTSLICRREVDFSRQLPDFSTSALHYSSLSVTAHFLLLDHGPGTSYLKTFSLPCHWQTFRRKLKLHLF